MMCYRDRTFCPYYGSCQHGDVCDRALTEEVKSKAEAWWGAADAPICVYVDKPGCFEE